MNNKEIETKDYFNDLNKIKETIRQNQNKAMVYVNSQMILTYYEIGTIINERKYWGSKYIQNLANDLKEYGKGYSYENLCRMVKFSNEFTDNEIMSQPVTQIPWGTLMKVIIPKSKSHEEMLFGTIINERKYWGSKYIQNLAKDLKEYGKGYSIHNLKRMSQFANEFSKDEFGQQLADKWIQWFTLIEIIYKSKTHEEMLYYINETYKNGWSRSMVLNQIAMKSYERSLIRPATTEIIKSDDSLNELGHGFSLVTKEIKWNWG